MATPLSPRPIRTPVCASHTPEQAFVSQVYDLISGAPRELRSSFANDGFPGHRPNVGIGMPPSFCKSDETSSCVGDGPGNGFFAGILESQLQTASSPPPCDRGQHSILSYNTAAIFHVFRNLRDPFELARAATVSRMWRDVASVPCLWTALLEKEHVAASQPSRLTSNSVSAQQRAPEIGNRHLVLPQNLLQPSWDVLSSPTAQLGRWLGIRRLVSAASRLEGVRGAWAAYAPATARLVVLDQQHQKVTFVELESAVSHSAAGRNLKGSSGQLDSAAYVPTRHRHNDTEQQRSVEQRLRSVQTRVSGLQLGSQDRSWPPPRLPCSDPDAVAQMGVTAPPGITHVLVPTMNTPRRDNVQDGASEGPHTHATIAQGAAGVFDPEPAEQQGEDEVDGLQSEERNKLQVVATCGKGMVATGHPDGRVLVWDSAHAALAYTLPVVEGCGRGRVFAMAGDGDLLAVAYKREVLVWNLHEAGEECRVAAGSSCGAQAQRGAAWHPTLAALIQPTLGTVIRSMAISARHGVLAMRSWDGVELREARGGRWLHSLPDRRNTAVLAAGDVLFVASSSPSFMGNSFLQFEIEVAAIDLAAVVAAARAADAGDAGGSDSSATAGAALPSGNVATVGAAPAARLVQPGAGGEAAPEEDIAGSDGNDSVTGSYAAGGLARRSSGPLVVRTVTPPQRFSLRGPPLAAFKWDQPMQLCLSGGMLLLRCLQFPVSAGQLAWPGMFAFQLGDLLAGLSLGRTCTSSRTVSADGESGAELGQRTSHDQAGRDVPVGGSIVDLQQQAQQQQRIVEAAATAADAPSAPVLSSAVVKHYTIQPEVLCRDGGFATWSAGQGTGSAFVQHSAASMHFLAAARHLVIVSEYQEIWVMDVPYCSSRRASFG